MSAAARLVLPVLLLLLASPAFAAYSLADAPLRGTVIYPDRAEVTRLLRLSLAAGENVIELDGVSPSLLDDSVQVSVSPEAGVRIVDVEVRRRYLAPREREDLRRLRDQLDEVERRLVTEQNALAVEQNSVDFLRQTRPFPQGQAVGFPAVRDYLEALEPVLAAHLERASALQQAIAGLTERRTELEKEIRNIGAGSDHEKQVRVTLAATRAGSVEMACSYQLRDVQWTPLYEVRADTRAGRAELQMFAVVTQGTGEDLGGEGLELSTARPAQHGPLPPLPPWRLDIYQPPVVAPYVSRMMADSPAKGRFAGMPELAEEAEPAAPPAPEVRSEATSLSYVLRQKVHVPADGQPHKLLVATHASAASFDYLLVPRLSRFARLTARLQEPFVFPLSSGELLVFLDGRFVRSEKFGRPIAEGGEGVFELGADETVTASYELVKRFTEPPGAFSSRTRAEYAYVAEVVNGKSVGVTVAVRDQVPVSAHEEIRVTRLEPAAAEAASDEQGVFTRTLTLAPGERQKLVTRFEVIWPEKQQLTGL